MPQIPELQTVHFISLLLLLTLDLIQLFLWIPKVEI